MDKLQLKIITPERVLFDDQIEQVSLPTRQGEITVLPKHIPLITLLQAGEIQITSNGKIIPMVISGGFSEVTGKKVLIMADTAERIEEIDEKRSQEAKKRAEEKLKEVRVDSQDYALIMSKIEKELARLRVWKKHKYRLGAQIPEQKKTNE